MATVEINNAVTAANEIGREKGVVVRYEYDRIKQSFRFRFYRHGTYVGCAAKPEAVMSKMHQFIEARSA